MDATDGELGKLLERGRAEIEIAQAGAVGAETRDHYCDTGTVRLMKKTSGE